MSATDNNSANDKPTIKINAPKGQIGSAIQRLKSQNPSMANSDTNIEVDTNQNESRIFTKKQISETRLKNLRKSSVGFTKQELNEILK